jgi:hypothetical protein
LALVVSLYVKSLVDTTPKTVLAVNTVASLHEEQVFAADKKYP